MKECCLLASIDPAAFSTFRRHLLLRTAIGDLSFAERGELAQELQEQDPDLLEWGASFAEKDLVGGPKSEGPLSSELLLYVKSVAELRRLVGPLDGLRIVEIGSGYGGLCHVLAHHGVWKHYTLVDLPECLALARAFLERCGVTNVSYLPLDAIETVGESDIVLSCGRFSELCRRDQRRVTEAILAKASHGLFFCTFFPRHFGITSYSQEELCAQWEKNGIPYQMMENGYGFLW